VKIAITANTSWNIWNFRMCLIKAFLGKGYEVIAIAPEDEYSDLLKKAGCTYFPVKMENKGSNPFKDLKLFNELRRIYKSSNPDIILQFTIKPNIYGTLAAKRSGIPVINNVSGLGTVFLHNNLVSKIAQLLYKFSFRYPAKVFFQNPDDLELFVNKKIVKRDIAGLVPGSGVDLSKYTVSEFKRNEPFIFLLIARLLYDKGIKEYIEAIRLLKARNIKAIFQLMGALDEQSRLGIYREELNSWIEQKLIEYIPFNDNINFYVENVDCVVLPSYREGTPKTLLEAAAIGKPLIATNVPGCREIVHDGQNGYLCEARNAKDLADKMQKLINLDNSELRAMGCKSREIVSSKFSDQLVVSAYMEEIRLRKVKRNVKNLI
jgi:glycosyltransferase involved in cell wall biosynthesis